MHTPIFPWMSEAPEFGYPDMGNGWFADKLTYEQWFLFNLDQRAHKNFLE